MYLIGINSSVGYMDLINIPTKIVLCNPIRVEAQLLKISNYFCYIPENKSEVDILSGNKYKSESRVRFVNGQ